MILDPLMRLPDLPQTGHLATCKYPRLPHCVGCLKETNPVSHTMGLSFRFVLFVSILSLCVSLSLLAFVFSSLFLCAFFFGVLSRGAGGAVRWNVRPSGAQLGGRGVILI
jgi:hypothetical protein